MKVFVFYYLARYNSGELPFVVGQTDPLLTTKTLSPAAGTEQAWEAGTNSLGMWSGLGGTLPSPFYGKRISAASSLAQYLALYSGRDPGI